MEILDKDFSKVPHSLIDSGVLAQLTRCQIAVLLTLNRFSGYRSRRAYPSVKTIAEMAGVNKNSVAPSVRKLAALGLISVVRTGAGFAFKNVYSMQWNVENTVPFKTDKCGKIERDANGRFSKSSSRMESSTCPSGTECLIPSRMESLNPYFKECVTCPHDTDKKENLETNIRDNTGSAWACPKGQASPDFEILEAHLLVPPSLYRDKLNDFGGNSQLTKEWLLSKGYTEQQISEVIENGNS